jgi:L-alanine-DL-glutamate epimerase-like enolase superfamily enzyme
MAPTRRLRVLAGQLAAPAADRSFAGSELDPVSGANAQMTITDIKPYPTWQGARNIMLVKVECEGGLYGWGEAGLSGRELAVEGAVNHYKQFLIGQDGMRIGALWQEMCKHTGLPHAARRPAKAYATVSLPVW